MCTVLIVQKTQVLHCHIVLGMEQNGSRMRTSTILHMVNENQSGIILMLPFISKHSGLWQVIISETIDQKDSLDSIMLNACGSCISRFKPIL